MRVKMNILLINPPWGIRDDSIWSGVASVMPPHGLAVLGALLEREGHTAKILDAYAEQVWPDQLLDKLKELGSFDIIGITATTPQINNAWKMAEVIKKESPETKIILGGVHPTVMPDESAGKEYVDAVVKGEGEFPLVELAAGKPFSEIRGLAYRSGDEIIHNEAQDIVMDLDSLPMAGYHLLPMDKYFPAVGSYKRLPAVSLLGTRGCPGQCTFCFNPFGKKIRVRSGESMAMEVKHLQDIYGIKEICFYDDTFTTRKKEVFAFCDKLDELGVDLTWSCFSRVDTVNQDVLYRMAEAGCHQIMYGVESASEKILKNIRKKTKLEQVYKAVKFAKNAKIDVRAAFMIGNPEETLEDMEETFQFALKLNPEIIIYNITTPFPGTEMFTWADENGYLLTKDWDKYDFSHPIMELPQISREELKEFYSKVFKRFYLRPGYLFMRLFKLRSLEDIKSAFRAFRAVMGV